jgi:hypothetical protein
MMLNASKNKSSLLNEGTYNAILNSIKGLPDEANPKRIMLGFTTPGYEPELFKELPVAFDNGKPLRKDTETLLGRELTASEAEAGFDTSTLKGKPCKVVVMHRSGSGGKTEAAVSLVLKP